MSEVLGRIQACIGEIYDVEVADIAPFLCGEAQARAVVGDATARGEVLLVAEGADGVFVGLYVAQDALARLERDGVHAHLDAFSLAAEGVSHFVYLLFRAENEQPVTQLELELQAEVDKYATAMLEGWGVGALRARSRELRHQLFAKAEFLDDEGTEAGDRYRVAHRSAARYVAHLEERYVAEGDRHGLVKELRRFYRLGAQDKLARASEPRRNRR